MIRSGIKTFARTSRARILHARSLATKVQTTDLAPCTKEILTNAPVSNTEIEINGWVSSYRVSKNVAFLDVKDGTTYEGIQCVIRPPTLLPADVKNGTGIQIKGVWSEGKGKQKYEVQVNDKNNGKIDVVGPVQELFPMIKKDHTLQYLRTIPEYRWRDPSLAAILRFRSQVETTLVNFFDSEMFTKTHPPLVTASDCEGAGELFKIESNSMIPKKEQFFGKEAFLTVSTQLHLEVLCAALNRVWTLSPCFRAEESDTNRHLSEFWMLEVEISFVDHVSQLTKFSEKMIKSVVKNLVDDHNGMGSNLINTIDKVNVETMTRRWEMLLQKDWDSITYTKAIEIVQQAHDSKKVTFETRPNWGDSLKSEHEKWLAGSYFNNPVFVTDYPLEEKAFYMKINEGPREGELKPTVACFDLLVPDIGELIGGSMREHDLSKLKKEIGRRGMDVTPLNWYLKLRENGTVPHGGYGMGFERLLQYLSCTENIRDVIPFPRSAENCLC